MDFNKFTQKSQEVLNQAQQLASQNGNQAIENGHLLKGIFLADQEVIPYLLGKLNVNQKALEGALDGILNTYPKSHKHNKSPLKARIEYQSYCFHRP